MTDWASKPSCRLCGYLERKLEKLRAGFHKKVDNLRYSFGQYEHPDSYNDVGSFPVPTPPIQNNFCNALGPFPESAPPPGWRRPQNLDLHEASGSNHNSNQNSECFDADAVNREEYRRQHEISNYEDLHRRREQLACPSLAEQLATTLQDVLLETPTSHHHSQPEFDPWKGLFNDPEEILRYDARDQHQTENNSTFQFGSMMDQHQTENNSTSTPFQYGSVMPGVKHQTENNSTSTPFQYGSIMEQHQTENNSTSTPVQYGSMMDQYQTENNITSKTVQYGSVMDQQRQSENNTKSTTFQYGSMMTGDTGESMMDTGASNCSKYILDPVAEEAPKQFCDYYWEMKRIVRGEPRGLSGRRGRGFSIMGRILYITIRLKAGRRILRRMRNKRPYSAPGQNRWTQPCTTKRIRTGGSPPSSVDGDLLPGQNRSRQHQCTTKSIQTGGLSTSSVVGDLLPGHNRSRQQCTTKRIQTGGSSPSSVVGVLLPGHNRSRQQCTTKRTQTGGSPASRSRTGQKSASYSRITGRNGKWFSEIRLSKAGKTKVWLGTYETEVHAALAADAGVHHCSDKRKEFNFPDLVTKLGPSQYQAVYALCLDGREEEAKAKVADLAHTHANTWAPLILGAC